MGGFDISPEQILFLPILWMSLTVHEFGHAYAAFKGGDNTASLQGRMTLNPLAHIDPIGTVLIPIVMMLSPMRLPLIGWAKPVPVNPARFGKRNWDVVVSLAGVALNLVFATVGMAGLKLFLVLGLDAGLSQGLKDTNLYDIFFIICRALIFLNLVLMLFNLIPIPPLDGSHILLHFIRTRNSALFPAFQFLERFGTFILIMLVWTGLFGKVLWPVLLFMVRILAFVFQVPIEAFGLI